MDVSHLMFSTDVFYYIYSVLHYGSIAILAVNHINTIGSLNASCHVYSLASVPSKSLIEDRYEESQSIVKTYL